MPDKSAPRIKWLIQPTYDQDGVQATAGIDSLGREHGDPIPLRPPVELRVSEGDELHRSIQNLFQRERARFQAAVEAEQFESEEEANDFLVVEDMFPVGNEPWEDIHEFPAEPPGMASNGPELAAGAVKGGTASKDASPLDVSQTASLGSGVGSLKETSTQKPTVVPASDTHVDK